MGSLDGKVAIVTGAGSGLGRAHAHALVAEGAAVVVNDFDAAAARAVVDDLTAAGGRAVGHAGSVSDWTTAEELVNTAIEQLGDLHVLVLNAGFTSDAMSFKMDEAAWDAVVDVHLKGHFAPLRFAGRWWREQAKAGVSTPRRVICTTSEAGLFGSPGQLNYAGAKAGIVGLALSFAREFAKYPITTNVIAPRARTAMTELMPLFAPVTDGFDRYDPANVSPVVCWLASDQAADVDGQVFIVVGAQVQVMAVPKVGATIEQGGRFTPAQLAERKGELFADQDPGLFPFG